MGTVTRAKAQKSARVEFGRRKFVPKYERYLKAKTAVIAHNPPQINAKEGDLVQVRECRPLSKTKSFIIIKVLGQDKKHFEKEESSDKLKEKTPKKEPKQAEQ